MNCQGLHIRLYDIAERGATDQEKAHLDACPSCKGKVEAIKACLATIDADRKIDESHFIVTRVMATIEQMEARHTYNPWLQCAVQPALVSVIVVAFTFTGYLLGNSLSSPSENSTGDILGVSNIEQVEMNDIQLSLE